MLERLQKIISRAGVASRRRAEELIAGGQVEVNGQLVTQLGSKADPERDAIRVSGRRLKMPDRALTLVLNKPDSCVSALVDPAGRTTLRDFLSGVAGRVFPVGGLEYHATGLVVLTTDGALASRLFRALGQGLEQTYWIKVKAPLKSEELRELARQIGALRPARSGANPWYEVRLAGGQLTKLRNLLHEIGHPVEKLKRTAIGRLELGELETGRWRGLNESELRLLDQDIERRASGLPVKVPAVTRPPSTPPGRKKFVAQARRGKAGTGGQRQEFPRMKSSGHRGKTPSRRKPA